MNHLYYGDRHSRFLSLHALRDSIAAESVDLIYLDPPFNSKRDTNLLFKSPKGHSSEAQIEAFEDTWHWTDQAEAELSSLAEQPNTDVTQMMHALVSFLGRNDMTAYLVMMGTLPRPPSRPGYIRHTVPFPLFSTSFRKSLSRCEQTGGKACPCHLFW